MNLLELFLDNNETDNFNVSKEKLMMSFVIQ